MWRSFRKAVAQSFNSHALQATFPVVRSCVEDMVRLWQVAQAEGRPVDVSSWMYKLMLEMLGRASYGLEFNALQDEQHEYLTLMHENLVQMGEDLANPLGCLLAKLLPFLPFARRNADRRARVNSMGRQPQLSRHFTLVLSDLGFTNRDPSYLKALRREYEKIYEGIKARGPPQETDQSLAANLMRVVDLTTGERFPEMTVKANLAVVTLAGFDTTASTLVWALYDIARHPGMQQRIKEELAAAGLLQMEGAPPARALEWADWNAMPYLNMVLKESMRIHPAVAFGVPRETSQDLNVGGYHIKRGTFIWMPFYATFNSRMNFSNPELFDPGRWRSSGTPFPTPASEASAEENAGMRTGLKPTSQSEAPLNCAVTRANGKGPSTPVQYRIGQYATPNGHVHAATSLMPFSMGSRSCVGQPLANMEARVALLIILSSFWCELAPSMPSHKEMEAAQVHAAVLTSGVPIMLQLKPHTSAK
ncbi:cytochrome P450 [Dunaliella salina]|uniref:Cytochrome P450 n=1 Tax=Dunaliella salina TaxID=3046 RepID=A0ABQ7GF47_DUNSA|nr:cytochrome P450 [Dunaliella salina]|eukprot:KAF5833230.1 cytochrome P450 [Dunaliella salina]